MTIQMHKKVKITVLRTEYYQELAEQYAIPNLGKCPFHQKGQVLYSDGINPPDGMCGVAWQVIAPMARQLSLGELVQPSGTWLNDDTIGVFACPDGIRPVIFLLTTERSKEDGKIHITLDVAQECIQKRVVRYDKTGDNHYDTISAFIKSLRGSDPDAAVYYLAKMLYAGEDIKFIARRIMISASEDVGNADPNALMVAVSDEIS